MTNATAATRGALTPALSRKREWEPAVREAPPRPKR